MAGALDWLSAKGPMNYFFPNPADEAMPYLDQIPGNLQQYFKPYIQSGQRALPKMESEYDKLMGNLPGIQGKFGEMMNDPTGFLQKMGAGYQQSPGFQNNLKNALTAAMNMAGAGGMAGTPQAQQSGADIAEQMSQRDFQDYLKNALGIFGMGLEGESGLYGNGLEGLGKIGEMGFKGATSLAEDLAQALMSEAQMKYAGQANQNNLLGSIFSKIGNFAFGGGG
jgi:hypothetical protein